MCDVEDEEIASGVWQSYVIVEGERGRSSRWRSLNESSHIRRRKHILQGGARSDDG